MKKTIQRIRQKEIMAPANPRTLDELVIPAEYKTTIDGKPFLLYDSNDEKSGKPRILIYSTEENLNLMTNCNNWYADGTFSSAPSIFYQLYTIHGIQYSNVLPFLFALLPNKTEETYVRLFEIILNLKLELKPTTFMLDFEVSTINAIKKVFPNTSLHGCFFHYSQALWRHIQDSGLAIKYREESNFALNIKKLNALSFVPPHLVINAYEAILETEFYIENETLLSDFLDYFESTWIGKLCRNKKRRNPRFPIELWNCYNLVKYDIPKTNNSVEGWHNSFNSTLNALHPSIWKFIEALKKEEKLNRLKMHRFLAGTEPRQKLKKYKDTASRVKAICNDFENRSINDFLKGIAQNLS